MKALLGLTVTMKALRGLALAALLASCATLPPTRTIPTKGVEWIKTASASCELPSAEAALTSAVGSNPDALAFARKVGAVESLIAREPMLAGNSVELLVDGPATHAAQLAAIRAAQHHIHLDVYILTDEKLGQAYADALQERARAGVKVRVIFDSIGGMGAGLKFRESLRNAGVELYEYNTVNPLKDPRLWRLNRRSHRKLLVVDGLVAFTGGINITDEYAEASPLAGSSGTGSQGWRDTHIKVQGPAVAEFQRAFLNTWEQGKGEIELAPQYWPSLPAKGDNLVRVVANEGADFLQLTLGLPEDVVRELLKKRTEGNDIYASYLTAISEARHRIWITQAYFAPNKEFLRVLKAAAKRGVDVRILMPGVSDVGLLPLAARSFYDEMLKAGIQLYEYQPVMIHAKTAVVDGVWSTVGSSNLDFRSFIHNDEANAVVIGQAFGAEMEQLYTQDLQQSKQISLAEWRKRPVLEKLKETSAALIKFWI